MFTHLTGSKFKLPATMDGFHDNTIRVLEENFHCMIMKKCIALKMKTKSETPVQFIIQDGEEVFLATRCLNRERTTEVHMKEITNKQGAITVIGVRFLRTFANNARDTIVLSKRTIQLSTSNIVLREGSSSSIHPNMTEVTMPQHRVQFKTGKRKRCRRRWNSYRRTSNRTRGSHSR